MNRQKTDNTLQAYYNACNSLLKEFCEKHEFSYEEAKGSWVSDDIGGTVCCGDYYFNMDVIVTDLSEDAHEDELIGWYDYQLRCGYLGLNGVNYRSWLKRFPIISEKKFKEMETAKKRVEEAEEELKRILEECK